MVDGGAASNAVKRTYDALAAKNMNQYLDSIDPAARNRPPAGTMLTFAVQLLGLPKVDFQDLSLRDMKYEVTTSTGTWAEVKVAGFVRNLQLGVENPINTTEVARKYQGQWYTSTAAVYAESPEGRAYAAAMEQQAAEGRKKVKILEVAEPESDSQEVWWRVTIENGDTTPHKVSLLLSGFKTNSGLWTSGHLNGYGQNHQTFDVPPLSKQVVKPAVAANGGQFDSEYFWKYTKPEDIQITIEYVDGKTQTSAAEIGELIKLQLVPTGTGLQFLSQIDPDYGQGWPHGVKTLGYQISFTNTDKIEHRFSTLFVDADLTVRERGDPVTKRISIELVGPKLAPGATASLPLDGPFKTNVVGWGLANSENFVSLKTVGIRWTLGTPGLKAGEQFTPAVVQIDPTTTPAMATPTPVGKVSIEPNPAERGKPVYLSFSGGKPDQKLLVQMFTPDMGQNYRYNPTCDGSGMFQRMSMSINSAAPEGTYRVRITALEDTRQVLAETTFEVRQNTETEVQLRLGTDQDDGVVDSAWSLADPNGVTLYSQPGRKPYQISVNTRQPVRFFFGWTAISQQILEENLRQMTLLVAVDGRAVDVASVSRTYRSSNGKYFIHAVDMVVTRWPAGLHSVLLSRKIARAINSGDRDWAPGEYSYEIAVVAK